MGKNAKLQMQRKIQTVQMYRSLKPRSTDRLFEPILCGIEEQILSPVKMEQIRQDQSSLFSAIPINVDNVADYMMNDYKDEWSWSDFPSLAPPFSNFFVD